MTHRLERRITKLEQGVPDNHLTQLTDDELLEYEAYLDARLEDRSTVLPAKFTDIDQAHVRLQSMIKGMTDEELIQYEDEIDRMLAELEAR